MHRHALALLGAAWLFGSLVSCGPSGAIDPVRESGEESATRVDSLRKRPAAMPSKEEMFRWIEDIYAFGNRRPGTAADAKTRRYLTERLTEFGLRDVRDEPIGLDQGFLYWYADQWQLTVGGQQIPSFYVPNTKHTSAEGVSGELVYVGERIEPGEDVRGKVVVADIRFGALSGPLLDFFSYFTWDPNDTVSTFSHPATWVRENFEGRDYVTEEVDLGVYGEAVDGGAVAFIGVLKDYPTDTPNYYGPYEGYMKSLPGLWISGPSGAALVDQLASTSERPQANVQLIGGFDREAITGNVIAELPGMSDDVIIVGTHHDGPWGSAVEDASGVAEVLALAKYYAALPRWKRPKTMIFVLQAGHFYNSIGGKRFLANHPDVLERAVIELHIEHVAKDLDPVDGQWVDTGMSEVRGIFASGNPLLIDFTKDAVVERDLARTLVLQTGSPLGVPGDGAMYWVAGIPIVQLISGPEWIFDPIDTPELVAQEDLVPVARAFMDMIDRVHRTPSSLLKSYPPVPPPLPSPPLPPYPGGGSVYEGLGLVKIDGKRHRGRGALYQRPAYIDTAPTYGQHELVYLGVEGSSWIGPWRVLESKSGYHGLVQLQCENDEGERLQVTILADRWVWATGPGISFFGTVR
jgi:hypothetical protein